MKTFWKKTTGTRRAFKRSPAPRQKRLLGDARPRRTCSGLFNELRQRLATQKGALDLLPDGRQNADGRQLGGLHFPIVLQMHSSTSGGAWINNLMPGSAFRCQFSLNTGSPAHPLPPFHTNRHRLGFAGDAAVGIADELQLQLVVTQGRLEPGLCLPACEIQDLGFGACTLHR